MVEFWYMAQPGRIAKSDLKNGLTPKQIKFIQAKAEGKNGQEAAKIAYDVKNDNVARMIASDNLTKPNIKEAIAEVMKNKGITLDVAIEPVRQALKDEELEMRLKGSDRALKLMGAFQNNNDQPSIHFHNHSNDHKTEYGV